MVAGFCGTQACGLKALDGAAELACECLGVLGIVESRVVHGQTAGPEVGREVAHGGEKEYSPLDMAGDVLGLFTHFHHEDLIALRVQ